MKINIDGGTPYQQELCYDFADHVLLSLCGPRLHRLLEIDLTIEQLGDHMGSCIATDTERLPRIFDVEVHESLQQRVQLQVLAHELVHVKQYARRELVQLVRGGYSWYGTKYPHITPAEEVWNKTYNRLPWEIEARGMEEVLFLEWAEERNITDDWAYFPMYA